MANDSLRRKLAFTTAFNAHGNVRRAMREAGVSSPTTAYRWLAEYRTLGTDWVDRPPRKTRSVPGDVADLVIRIAETEPGWGKARIARQANTLLAGNAISPNGVQSVLRDAGLWPLEPGSPPSSGTLLNPDELVNLAQDGIRLDVYGEPHAAIRLLEPGLWHPARLDPETFRQLLRAPEEGNWLLRGLLQYSHALINAGRWRSARSVLIFIDDWLESPASQPTAARTAFQDRGRRYLDRDGEVTVVAFGALPARVPRLESVSLRTDDIWVETQQYLALVVRDFAPGVAVDRLDRAAREMARPSKRSVFTNGQAFQGAINHDLSVAQLKAGWPLRDAYASIHLSLSQLDPTASPGLVASAWLQLASIQRREASLRGEPEPFIAEIERSIQSAMAAFPEERGPILRANAQFHALDLTLRLRPPTADDRAALVSLAHFTIDQRMSRRARQLLAAPHLCDILQDLEEDLAAAAWPDVKPAL